MKDFGKTSGVDRKIAAFYGEETALMRDVSPRGSLYSPDTDCHPKIVGRAVHYQIKHL